jgi:hypothetical protein
MKQLILVVLMLIGIIWAGCKKEDYCWHCTWETPQGYVEDTWDTVFCDRSDDWIDSLNVVTLIDPLGNEFKFLGCEKE